MKLNNKRAIKLLKETLNLKLINLADFLLEKEKLFSEEDLVIKKFEKEQNNPKELAKEKIIIYNY